MIRAALLGAAILLAAAAIVASGASATAEWAGEAGTPPDPFAG